jgi:N-acetylglucosaminyldiphosphoundecaprenol N-acetyl-beta-D-mannosaminyltransferase
MRVMERAGASTKMAVARDRPEAGRSRFDGPYLVWGRVIGLPVIAGTMDAVSDEILRRGEAGEGGYVCVANVHMLVTARRDPAFRPVVEQAPMVVSDGRPLVWQLHAQGLGHAEQCYGPDLTVELCRKAATRGMPIFFYGGDDRVRDRMVGELRRRFPEIRIVGAEPAPMLPAEPPLDADLVERVRASGAALVFCALGCPKQEFWMRTHAPHLRPVLLGVGQAFNIIAGTLPDAPRWMRDRGLGWLYRLKTEPGRLWRRYLVTNSLFLGHVGADKVSGLLRRRQGTPEPK